MIINIGSIGGWKSDSSAGLYYGSKFAIEGIKEINKIQPGDSENLAKVTVH